MLQFLFIAAAVIIMIQMVRSVFLLKKGMRIQKEKRHRKALEREKREAQLKAYAEKLGVPVPDVYDRPKHPLGAVVLRAGIDRFGDHSTNHGIVHGITPPPGTALLAKEYHYNVTWYEDLLSENPRSVEYQHFLTERCIVTPCPDDKPLFRLPLGDDTVCQTCPRQLSCLSGS